MKILISADWHLKLGQKSVPKEWATSRYRMLFKQLHELESSVELHVIAGDFADKVPSMEELSLYFEFIRECTIETIIIPGNHEATGKSTTFLTHLKDVTNDINPLVRIIDDYYTYKGVDFIPYNKLKEFEKHGNDFLDSKVLITHCRGEIPPHVKPEVDLSIFDRWTTVIAGDLHSYENCQRNILYPGSPVTTSFHREKVDTGVLIFNTENHSHEWIKLDLPQLLRKTVSAGSLLESTPYHHTIYEIEGDMTELGLMKDNDLIDKKVIKRSTDVALVLTESMTLQDEVSEYLLYVLELEEEAVLDILQILNNNISKINE